MTRKNLIEVFQNACAGFVAYMDYSLEAEFPINETTVTIPFMDTQMDDIDTTWWDEENISNFHDYFKKLPSLEQLQIVQDGYSMIGMSDSHRQERELLSLKMKNKRAMLEIYPHPIGNKESDYGRDVRTGYGYETLSEVCAELGNVEATPYMVLNPQGSELRSSFLMAVKIVSVDDMPLRGKIEQAHDAGLFLTVRSHFNLD